MPLMFYDFSSNVAYDVPDDMINLMKSREVSPYHPLFRALSCKQTRKATVYDDANSRAALVSFADELLKEIFKKVEKNVADYNADTERLRKSYDSMRWLSWKFPAKLYAGLGLLQGPLDDINLAELKDGIKENRLYDDALELLVDAKLIELGVNVRITQEGREYLKTLS